MIVGPNSDLLVRALTEIRAVDVGGVAQPELLALALETENEILDQWNADRGLVYADQFLPFTMQTAHQPTTIGPTGADWVTTQAPVSIEGMQVLLTGTPTPYVFVKPRSAQWWQRLSAPTVTTPFPTDFFYNPAWTPSTAPIANPSPNGEVYLWPVPTQTYQVQVWCRMVLAQLLSTTRLSLPPGYWRALMLSTAKAVASAIPKPWSGLQDEQLRVALMKIEANNTVVPQVATWDSGMPRGRSQGLPNFFWPDGSLR